MSPLSAHISVVIPTCNRPQLLERCVASVGRAIEASGRSDVEVIVTDDSTDELTRQMLADHPRVKWYGGPRKGPASNRNSGVRGAGGTWILFVDDDCIVDPNWIAAFLAAIEDFPNQQVFEGKTIADRPRERLDEESPSNESGGYLWSCNMAITRALFDRLGGFCESFPNACMEDVDFRLRLESAGERFPFIETAVVCHPLRASKGVSFLIKSGRSYLHLISRHPELVSRTRWLQWAANSARRTRTFMREAWAYHFRGFPHGIAELVLGVYFELVARLRYSR